LKEIVEYFSQKSILFKSLKEIDKRLLNSRKKIWIFSSTDTKLNYHSIFSIAQKSRFLVKNAVELVEIEYRLQQFENHNFKYRHLMIDGKICSKATSYLRERGWKMNHDFM